MIDIRHLTTAQANDYRTLRLLALQDTPDAYLTTYEEQLTIPVEDIAERMTQTLDEGGLYIGAYDGNKLVGMLLIVRPPRLKRRHLAYVYGVYVANTHRRQGIALAMMKEVMRWVAEQDGLEMLQLSAAANNTPAVRLYESLGFEIWGREPRAFKLEGEDGYTDEIHMALLL